MGTATKSRGRRTTMKLPILKIGRNENIWNNYETVGWMSIKSGFTTTAILNWIRQGKIKGYTYNGGIIIRKDESLPPRRFL